MEKYIGTKQIEAEPMIRKEYNERNGYSNPLGEDDEGYIVKYPDGYISWSPKKQFEEAYSKIGVNLLFDTALLMKSCDFKDRFRAEYIQLQNRRKGLKKMLVEYADGTLKFIPKCSYDLLHSQIVYMDGYLAILEKRAEIEGIDLKEDK